jgi:hypothetical protein
VLDGVGHFPHVERPGDVVALLDDFIDTTSPSTQAVAAPMANQPYA